MLRRNVLEYFEDSVGRFSSRTAVQDREKALSYGDLMQRARQIGAVVAARQAGDRNPVVVYLPNCVDAVVAFLGVVYAGCFYVPVGPDTPARRAEKICRGIGAKSVVTTRKYLGQLTKMGWAFKNVILAEEVGEYGTEVQKTTLLTDADPIYVLHTSGSTGTPKGVVIAHRSVIDYVTWAIDCFGITHEDRIANQAPFEFDNSTFDIYVALFSGATLLILDRSLYAFPPALVSELESARITTLFWVPTILRSVASADALRNRSLPLLRRVLFAGEVMTNDVLNYWRHHVRDAMFANLYGPTEITVDCTYFVVDREFDDDEPLPIGFACPNTRVVVLNENDEQVSHGQIGELCVCGSSLALGYYNDPVETAKAFVPNPLNDAYHEPMYRTGDRASYNGRGELMFHGRRDSQVKINGRRIELGEIDAALLCMDEIDFAASVFFETEGTIVSLYHADSPLSDHEIKRSLLETIPRYMVPGRLQYVDTVPVNRNGKVDRSVLRDIAGYGSETSAPRAI